MKTINNFIIEKLKLNAQSKLIYNYSDSYSKLEKFINQGTSKWRKPIEETNGFTFETNKLYHYKISPLFNKWAFIYVLEIDSNSSDDECRVYNVLLIRQGNKEKINMNYCKFDTESTVRDIWVNIGNRDDHKYFPNVDFYINDENFFNKFLDMINDLYNADVMEHYDIIKEFNDLCFKKNLISINI